MTKTILAALSLLIFSAASASETYVYDIFADKEKCEQAKRHRANCYQRLVLKDDGRAVVMFTDILNGGRYEIVGDQITVTFDSPHEIGDLTFFYSSNRKFLIEAGTRKVWEPQD